MSGERPRTASGRALDELTMDALLQGALGPADFRISAHTLRRQARAAEEAGYPHLAGNLRRAAELTAVSNDELLQVYQALRPGRGTYGDLLELAAHLEAEHDAPLTARLIREAAEVYRERGIVRPDADKP